MKTISNDAASPATRNHDLRGHQRRGNVCNSIGVEERFGFMACSGSYCGKSSAGDSMPRA